MIAPANTGRDSRRRITVIKTDHTNRGIRSNDIFDDRILIIVVMKLIAPRIEETPAKWREKMVKSTDAPEWNRWVDRGGYTVQPVPDPESENEDINSKDRDGGNNQKLILFIRGKAMSGEPIIKGMSQFPNPPIIIGITIKKIITKAWAVTIVL